MAAYLFAARVSELVSKKSPSDHKTTSRGPLGTDVKVKHFQIGTRLEDVAVFTIKTAKRQGIERNCALPLSRQYEPWTRELVDYFNKCGPNSVFPFTRQLVRLRARSVFDGLTYPTERYAITNKEGLRKVVERHSRPFKVHASRHSRTTELVETYEFDAMNLSLCGGWTLRNMLGVGPATERYVQLSWRHYLPKLLRPPT